MAAGVVATASAAASAAVVLVLLVVVAAAAATASGRFLVHLLRRDHGWLSKGASVVDQVTFVFFRRVEELSRIVFSAPFVIGVVGNTGRFRRRQKRVIFSEEVLQECFCDVEVAGAVVVVMVLEFGNGQCDVFWEQTRAGDSKRRRSVRFSLCSDVPFTESLDVAALRRSLQNHSLRCCYVWPYPRARRCVVLLALQCSGTTYMYLPPLLVWEDTIKHV